VVPGWAALAVYVFACLAIVADGVPDKPIDYRHVAVTAWWMLVFGSIGIVFGLGFFLAFARNVQPVSARFAAVVVVGGLVAVAAVGAWRGVVTPWTPVATTTDGACEELDRAGVDALWPGAQRRTTDRTDEWTGRGQSSACTWTIDAGSETPPYSTIATTIRLYKDDRFTSGVRLAANWYVTRHLGLPGRRTVAGVGDEATASDHWNGVTVTARRANVVVEVAVYTSGHAEADRIARDLAKRMSAGIHTSPLGASRGR
jgi:hypothetical protein